MNKLNLTSDQIKVIDSYITEIEKELQNSNYNEHAKTALRAKRNVLNLLKYIDGYFETERLNIIKQPF
ncbi:hypothetical protein AXJ14_gp198 [Geobacillus virus E3]|uniref:hypothetical protein n=1 Tax=Geobacillus virus E3 TaxID=1572712 RepID=UPI000671AA3E|nr:hypothetical protein AXJ14_gp198 [Geobacillus virus E3]AJA41517.1 hypothetical protein E3_0198 [Geobacillus virus E3]